MRSTVGGCHSHCLKDPTAGSLDFAAQQETLAVLPDLSSLQAVQVSDHVGPLELVTTSGQSRFKLVSQHDRQERAEHLVPRPR